MTALYSVCRSLTPLLRVSRLSTSCYTAMSASFEREKRLCARFLGSEWGCLERVTVERCTKGCSNKILIATLRDETSGNIVDQAMVKYFGVNLMRPTRLIQDVFITCYLGHMLDRIPKVRGIFENGRLEEYIPSENISRDRFEQDYERIITLMASLNNLTDIPFPRDQAFLKSDIKRMISISQCPDPVVDEWQSEVNWFLGVLAKIEARHHMRVALCHNDVNHNNILIPEAEGDDRFILIDYEYTGYNYTVFDIANYCAELQYDWSLPEPPHYTFDEEWLPNDELMLKMIRVHKRVVTPPITTPDHIMLNQVKFMIIGSELYWALWGISINTSFNVDLDTYTQNKMRCYYQKKRWFAGAIEELLKTESRADGDT